MATLPATDVRPTASASRVVGGLAVVLALAMVAGGTMKLAGQSTQVEAFTAVGLPVWFRALVGTFEVVGGFLLAAPATRPAGSVILATILVGAAWTHAANGQWGPLGLVLVLLTLFLWIFWRERPRAIELLGGR